MAVTALELLRATVRRDRAARGPTVDNGRNGNVTAHGPDAPLPAVDPELYEERLAICLEAGVDPETARTVALAAARVKSVNGEPGGGPA